MGALAPLFTAAEPSILNASTPTATTRDGTNSANTWKRRLDASYSLLRNLQRQQRLNKTKRQVRSRLRQRRPSLYPTFRTATALSIHLCPSCPTMHSLDWL